VLLIAASVTAGAIRGVFTLTEATVVSDYWGPHRYAVLNGVFNAPLIAAGAVAPSIGVAIATASGSYPALFAILAATAATGAALAAAAPSPPASGHKNDAASRVRKRRRAWGQAARHGGEAHVAAGFGTHLARKPSPAPHR